MSLVYDLPTDASKFNKMKEKLKFYEDHRQLIMNLQNFDQFLASRDLLIKLILDIENDLRDSLMLVDQTTIQNEDKLFEKNEFKEMQTQNFQSELKKQNQLMEELKSINIKLNLELKDLQERNLADGLYIQELEQRLLSFEGNNRGRKEEMQNLDNSMKEKEINLLPENSSHKSGNSGCNRNTSSTYIINTSEINSNNQRTKIKNTYTYCSNFSEIIKERENHKKILNSLLNEQINKNTTNSEAIQDIDYTKPYQVNSFDEVLTSYHDQGFKTKLKESINIAEKNTQHKANRVTNILLKLNSNEDINSIINKLFGDKLLNQLMSKGVNEDLLEKVEQTIVEIENLKTKENDEMYYSVDTNMSSDLKYEYPHHKSQYSNKSDIPTNMVIEEREENEDEFHNKNKIPNNIEANHYFSNFENPYYKTCSDILSTNNLTRSKTISKFNLTSSTIKLIKSPSVSNSNSKQEKYCENKFENSLRKYTGHFNSGKNIKLFKHYTKPFGNFFDPSLQKGGKSKYEIFETKNRSKSKTKVNGRYLSISNLVTPSKSLSTKTSFLHQQYSKNQFQFS